MPRIPWKTWFLYPFSWGIFPCIPTKKGVVFQRKPLPSLFLFFYEKVDVSLLYLHNNNKLFPYEKIINILTDKNLILYYTIKFDIYLIYLIHFTCTTYLLYPLKEGKIRHPCIPCREGDDVSLSLTRIPYDTTWGKGIHRHPPFLFSLDSFS